MMRALRKSWWVFILATIVFLCGTATGFAQARSTIWQAFGSEFFTGDHFSNNFWSLHDTLKENYGLIFEIVSLQDFFWNTHGGIKTHDSGEYPRLIGFYFELDTEKAGLWRNGTLFASFEIARGHSPTERSVGDWQWLSNIDGENINQISELWYRHGFFDDRLWIKLGKMEGNYDFSSIEYGLEFIHSSAGYVLTIPMVTYPDQDWGAVIGTRPLDWFSMNFGVYQGDINGSRSLGHTIGNLRGPMVIGEPTFHYTVAGKPGSLGIGGWWNGRRFEAYHEQRYRHRFHGKSAGWYVTLEQTLWRENPQTEGCEQGIGLFAQYGWAPKDRSEVEDALSIGLQWTGALPGRDEDALGLGAFTVWFSDKAGFDERYETAFEFFYKAQVFGWLAVKPDMQYIVNPGGTKRDNALALGGRLEIVF
ncbi:MAG: carbohydrate porin [Desulfobacterota bacterium]|nr:carbohydrate porin [Thermodesulfobacteriota bacterium]